MAEYTQQPTHEPKSQLPNLKSQISNLKSQISNLKSQISNLKPQIQFRHAAPQYSMAPMPPAASPGRAFIFILIFLFSDKVK